MKTYLIAYESVFTEDTNIETSIKTFDKWAHPFKNTWLIKTYYSKEVVNQKLRTSSSFIVRLLVIQVTNDWISYNLPQDIVKWMQEGL